MLYDENEVLRVCEKYGIETVEKEGFPLYMGEEIDENFSISEIMNETMVTSDVFNIYPYEVKNFTMSASFDERQFCNSLSETLDEYIVYEEDFNEEVFFDIHLDEQNKCAA